MSCEDDVANERAYLARIREDYPAVASHQTAPVSPQTFRTGDRVYVVPIGQRGVVRGHRGDRTLVHFGTADTREVFAWYPTADLLRDADMIEVLRP